MRRSPRCHRCGHPRNEHTKGLFRRCTRCSCEHYTENLRAEEEGK